MFGIKTLPNFGRQGISRNFTASAIVVITHITSDNHCRRKHLPRYRAYIILFFLTISRITYANILLIPKDSVVYKDTLIETKLVHENRPWRFGGGGSYGLNFFKDGLLPSPLSTSCDIFQSGKGNGWNGLIRADFPMGGESGGFYFSPVISYENFGADHTWGEFGPARDSAGNSRSVQFDHVITNSTKAIGVKALLGFQFLKQLSFEFGPVLYYLFDQKYVKTKKAISLDLLISPSGEAVREYTEASGAIPNANNIMAALSFSLGVEFPLSKKFSASPNIEFLLPITQTTNYWTLNSLRFGMTFRYDLDGHSDTITEYHKDRIPVHIDIPEEKKPALVASIDAVVINREGKEEHVVRMEVEEVKVHYAYPMLNYIFFGENSSKIAPRYIQYESFTEAQKNFKESSLNSKEGLLKLYLGTLNILGDRLRKSPATKITLTGCTSNTGNEENNFDLALKRAASVEDYLVKVWQIDPKRIKKQSRLLPDKPSPLLLAEGQQENRRVEITSNDETLTDPLIVTKTEHIANPPNITLQPHIFAEAGMKSFREGFSIAGKELTSFTENDYKKAPQKTYTVTEEALSSNVDSLDLFLEVTDSAGNMMTARNSIKLEQKRIQRDQQQELEKFSLILFAFDESTLGAKNERTLGLVAESFKKVKPEKLSVVGYTDELGEVLHNDELSRRRASEATAELEHALRARGLSLPATVLIDGKGSREKLYDNSLPEGRFFSRTVNITLEHGK